MVNIFNQMNYMANTASPKQNEILPGAIIASLCSGKNSNAAIIGSAIRGAVTFNIISLYSSIIPSLPLASALSGMTVEYFAQLLPPTRISYEKILRSGLRYGLTFDIAAKLEMKLSEGGTHSYTKKVLSGAIAGVSGLIISESDLLLKRIFSNYLNNQWVFLGLKGVIEPIAMRVPGFAAIGSIAYSLFSTNCGFRE